VSDGNGITVTASEAEIVAHGCGIGRTWPSPTGVTGPSGSELLFKSTIAVEQRSAMPVTGHNTAVRVTGLADSHLHPLVML